LAFLDHRHAVDGSLASGTAVRVVALVVDEVALSIPMAYTNKHEQQKFRGDGVTQPDR
jgi:hypothetical protein